jgi:hypothetical protein
MRLTPSLILTLLCLPLGVTACGDDDDDDGGSQPQVFEVQTTEEGKETRVTAPPSVTPGAVEVRVSNEGKESHSIHIVQLGDGHTAAEVTEAGEGWGEGGGELPDWIRFMGGIGDVPPGGSAVSVVDLPEGDYAAFDIEGNEGSPYAEFTVEGDEGAALPEVDATIEAVEYGFTAGGLRAGSQQVRIENAGEEPHHVVAAPMKPGATEDDFLKAIRADKTPPIDESKAFSTAIISGGESEVVDLRFESGEWGLVCFIPDRAGGPPHAFKGMAQVITVE